MNLKNKENFSPKRVYKKFATPTFPKKISSKLNSFQCDFDDEMINQNIGINAVLSINSPHTTSKQVFFNDDDEPKDDQEMEMINNSIRTQGLRQIENKENLMHPPQEDKVIIRDEKIVKKSVNRYEGKENEKKKLKLRKKKKSVQREINQDKIMERSKLTERVKEQIEAALTERVPVAKNLLKNVEEYICKKERKLRQLRVEQEVKTMRQCTFTPTTNKNNSSPRRNFQAFLESQQAFSTKVELKRQQLKQRKEELQKSQESFRPVINKSSKQKKKKQKPAYERLYELKDQKKNYETVEQNIDNQPKSFGKRSMIQQNDLKKATQFHTKASNGFSVTSNMRKTPVGELLYEDAMRRSNFKKTVVKNHLTSSSIFTSQMEAENLSKSPRKINKKNEKFVTQKLIKEYCFALEKFELLPKFLSASSEQSSEDKIDALQFTHGEYFYKKSINAVSSKDAEDIAIMEEVSLKDFQNILRQLGFLLYEQEDDCELAYREKSLALQAYELLEEYGVNIKNICVLLLALIGIFSVDPLNFGSGQNFDENQNGQNFQLNEKQGRKIQKYFDLLHYNRLTSSQKCKTDKIQQIPRSKSNNKHKEYTDQLASKYRYKMIEKTNQRFLSNKIDIIIPDNNILTHEDMLVINQIGKNLSIEKERKEKRENDLDEECTFHPKVNKKYHKEQKNEMASYLRSSEELKSSKGMNKSKELYQYAKIKKKMFDDQVKIQRSHEQQSLMIDSKSLKKSKGKNMMHNPFPRAKDVDKTIARMHQARKNREEKEEFLKKGWPLKKPSENDKKTQHCKSEIHQEENQGFLSWRPITDRSPAKLETENTRKSHELKRIYVQNEKQQWMDERQSATERCEQPFLMIDVNMENQTHQIQFYSGDEQKLEQIVNQFCRKHELDEISKQQLLELVVDEISNYLNDMGIESTATEV